jgi:hypothetical protein
MICNNMVHVLLFFLHPSRKILPFHKNIPSTPSTRQILEWHFINGTKQQKTLTMKKIPLDVPFESVCNLHMSDVTIIFPFLSLFIPLLFFV